MRTFSHALLIGSVAGLTLIASQSYAQDQGTLHYGSPPERSYYGAPPEEVIVRPLRHNLPERSNIGADIQTVSYSRAVPIGDLDLRTERGARELQSRISFTATSLCNTLYAMNPIAAGNSGGQWPYDSECYRNAVRGAMAQAHEAIRQARGNDAVGTYGGY